MAESCLGTYAVCVDRVRVVVVFKVFFFLICGVSNIHKEDPMNRKKIMSDVCTIYYLV